MRVTFKGGVYDFEVPLSGTFRGIPVLRDITGRAVFGWNGAWFRF